MFIQKIFEDEDRRKERKAPEYQQQCDFALRISPSTISSRARVPFEGPI